MYFILFVNMLLASEDIIWWCDGHGIFIHYLNVLFSARTIIGTPISIKLFSIPRKYKMIDDFLSTPHRSDTPAQQEARKMKNPSIPHWSTKGMSINSILAIILVRAITHTLILPLFLLQSLTLSGNDRKNRCYQIYVAVAKQCQQSLDSNPPQKFWFHHWWHPHAPIFERGAITSEEGMTRVGGRGIVSVVGW